MMQYQAFEFGQTLKVDNKERIRKIILAFK